MRTGLVVFGVVFVVLSGVLYLLSSQTFSATTMTSTPTDSDVRVSSASVNIPWEITAGIFLVGIVMTVFGLIMPGMHDVRDVRVYE